ncbi:MAG: hypothetical protein SOZ59_15695 [Candidatus Limivivens sp.]|nr:hypothetical protein [Candidatus Limivivens sp.]
MKKKKRDRGAWEFELLGAFAGMLILVCASIYFFREDYAPMAALLATGIGGVLNAVLSVLEIKRKKYFGGVCLGVAALALLVLFFLRIAVPEG